MRRSGLCHSWREFGRGPDGAPVRRRRHGHQRHDHANPRRTNQARADTDAAELEAHPVPGPAQPANPPDPTVPHSSNPDPGPGSGSSPVTLLPPPAQPSGVTPLNSVQYVFNGQSQLGGAPADPSVAGGPSNVVEEVNARIGVYTRGGALLTSSSLNTWFQVPGDSIFDTHVIFEPQGKRFMVMAEDGTKNQWLLSVSSTSDATGGWCTYKLDALNSGDGNTSVDFPLIGSSPTSVVLTIVEKPNNGNRVFVMQKTPLEACQSAIGLVWQDIDDTYTRTPAHPVVPVLNYDGTDSNTYLIDSRSDGGSSVSLYTISASNNFSSAAVGVPSYSDAPPAAQSGSSVLVDVGNTSITQAVNYKTGLYAAWTTGAYGGKYAAIQWIQLAPKTATLLADNIFAASGFWYFYPSVSVGLDGRTLFTYALSSTMIHPSVAEFSMDANHNVTANQYINSGSYTTPQSTTCAGKPCSRWGDFSTTYTDPVNVDDFWSVGETMVSNSQWGTAIGYS